MNSSTVVLLPWRMSNVVLNSSIPIFWRMSNVALNCLVSPGIALNRIRYDSARTVSHVWSQSVERQRSYGHDGKLKYLALEKDRTCLNDHSSRDCSRPQQ